MDLGEITENVEGDRLSNLPDDLIHKILSFISIKHVVQTSALSSRWRYIWTSMPFLNFSTKDFPRLPRFSKFVTRLLSSRNNQSEVFSVDLTFRGKGSPEFVQRILDYAFSHNVQQLNITCLPGRVYYVGEFPPSLFSSQSLKHLTMTGRIQTCPIPAAPTWVLPNLTTLNLSFYDDKCAALFSNCPNLKNLTLKNCSILNSFRIHHSGLSSLTLENGRDCVKVVTPQLKNLTIKYWRGIHLISAPNLSSLRYTDHYCCYKDNDDGPLLLPTDLCHLEKVDVCIDSSVDNEAYTRKIFCQLQQLHCVKFLTLNLELVKFISSSKNLISHQPTSPFVNLKSLKIYPVTFLSVGVTLSSEIQSYLLGGSPSAAFTLVSHEEIRAVKNVTSARNLMNELHDKLKGNIETDASHALTEHEQLRRKYNMVEMINKELTKVPASHQDKDKLRARFYGLLVEVKTLFSRDEPATSSQPSS
ncbi:putative F-box domain, leucine-rich repeat domain superfamily, F-box-like domain superfamily [Helianthus annuus]|nr:putative F-box domain, leucine-rich repeat domain superfamily, F-box-like domain superfamily [Helianthus annuus]